MNASIHLTSQLHSSRSYKISYLVCWSEGGSNKPLFLSFSYLKLLIKTNKRSTNILEKLLYTPVTFFAKPKQSNGNNWMSMVHKLLDISVETLRAALSAAKFKCKVGYMSRMRTCRPSHGFN